jgi:hypothetical protein
MLGLFLTWVFPEARKHLFFEKKQQTLRVAKRAARLVTRRANRRLKRFLNSTFLAEKTQGDFDWFDTVFVTKKLVKSKAIG